MEDEVNRYEVKNLTRSSPRAFYTAARRMVTLAPGESRVVSLTTTTAIRLQSPSVSVSMIGAAASDDDGALGRKNIKTADNPVAIEALLAKIEAKEISWQDLRQEADVFLDPTPSTKAEIIDALAKRAAELRAAR